jgi:peptidoglycan/xylan/chitin deacetylase (PgdA/CDA1 family)
VREASIIRCGEVVRRLGGRSLIGAVTPRPNVRVSLTHYVRPADFEQFRRIVTHIGRLRRLLLPSEFFAHYSDPPRAPLQEEAHLITFDDGLLSSYEAAQRVLNPLGIKAIFFVPTKVLELDTPDEMRRFAVERIYRRAGTRNSLTEHHYLTMNADHLRALHAQGHMVLPHTHSHAKLSELATEADVERELREPRGLLEQLLQAPADGFAFPVGTERVVTRFAYEHIRATYSLCFLGLSGVNTPKTDPAYICRDCIHPFYPLSHVTNVLGGVYDPYYLLKRRRLRARAEGRSPALASR